MLKSMSHVILAIMVCLLASLAQAAEFSATVVSKAEGQAVQGKVFVKGDKMRNEMKMGDETNITITRPDKKVVWIAMPEQKMYMEMPLTDKMQQKMMMKDPEDQAKMKHLGADAVNGYDCDKYQFDTVLNGKSVKQYVWIAKQLKMAIKSQTEDGSMTMEYRDIKVGAVPDSVFDIPQGYQKMDMPFHMPPSR
jgi:hypothetical protein